jgi:hypothetical protein
LLGQLPTVTPSGSETPQLPTESGTDDVGSGSEGSVGRLGSDGGGTDFGPG